MTDRRTALLLWIMRKNSAVVFLILDVIFLKQLLTFDVKMGILTSVARGL